MPKQPTDTDNPHQNVTRRQHMVPQSYLRRFAFNPGVKRQFQRVWAYDKKERRCFPAVIADVAQERDFNDLPLEVLADSFAELVKSPESALSRVEDGFKGVLDDFVENAEEKGIAHEARPALAAVVAVQIMRTRATRARMTVALADMAPQHLQALLDQDIAPETGRTHAVSADTPENLARLAQFRFLFDAGQMTDLCSHLVGDYLWFVGVNEDSEPLYSSDNPAAFWCEREPFDGAPDIAATIMGAVGTRLAFPVTPRLLILLFERTAWPELVADDGEIVVCPAEEVAKLNALQVMGSYRQVFCRTASFDLAEGMYATMPDLADSDRRIRALLNATLVDNGVGRM